MEIFSFWANVSYLQKLGCAVICYNEVRQNVCRCNSEITSKMNGFVVMELQHKWKMWYISIWCCVEMLRWSWSHSAWLLCDCRPARDESRSNLLAMQKYFWCQFPRLWLEAGGWAGVNTVNGGRCPITLPRPDPLTRPSPRLMALHTNWNRS